KLNLIFQLNPLLASHAFTNLFRECERIFSTRVLAFSDDEVRMLRRHNGAAATLPFHSHLIDDLPGADRARRRVLEETTCGARTVRQSRESTALRVVHMRFGLL